MVTTCTTRFNVQQFYVLPTQCIYVFCVVLRLFSYTALTDWFFFVMETCCILMDQAKINLLHHCTSANVEVQKQPHAQYGHELSASRSDRFTPDERAPGKNVEVAYMGPRVGVDILEKKI